MDVLGLKRYGRWRSSTFAESYVEYSIENKLDFAQTVVYDDHLRSNGAAVSNESMTIASDNIANTTPKYSLSLRSH